jgi:predicted RNase H-like nuclease
VLNVLFSPALYNSAGGPKIVDMSFFAGVDGCRGGWACARIGADVSVELGIIPIDDVAGLRELLLSASLSFIDMPMGLAGAGSVSSGFAERACDREARRLLIRLGGPSSSVFPVPVRAAVYADSYDAACDRNRKACGRALSVQAWNIVPKIRRLDRMMRADPDLKATLFESHPEVCFRAFAAENELFPPKRKPAGAAARFALLGRLLPGIEPAVEKSARAIPRSEAGIDDLLDALVLCAAARDASGRRPLLLPRAAPEDGEGVPARIAVPATPRVRSCSP